MGNYLCTEHTEYVCILYDVYMCMQRYNLSSYSIIKSSFVGHVVDKTNAAMMCKGYSNVISLNKDRKNVKSRFTAPE
jgi:hypothetical protein